MADYVVAVSRVLVSLDQTLAGATCCEMQGIATSGGCRDVVVDVFGSRGWSRYVLVVLVAIPAVGLLIRFSRSVWPEEASRLKIPWGMACWSSVVPDSPIKSASTSEEVGVRHKGFC